MHHSSTLWSSVLFTIPSCMCPRGCVYWWVVCKVITHYFSRGQGNMLSSRSSVSEAVSESAGLEWGRTGLTITALLCSASLRLRSWVPSICWMAWMKAKTEDYDLDSNAIIRSSKKKKKVPQYFDYFWTSRFNLPNLSKLKGNYGAFQTLTLLLEVNDCSRWEKKIK